MVIDWGAVIPPILIGIPSFFLGYWGLRRSSKVDEATERSGVLTEARAGTTLTFERLNGFVDQLQEDNKDLRTERDALGKERDDLKRELTRFQRKYGNGDNGP